MITGSNNNYGLTFGTGVWGRDIAIPVLASAVSFGAGAIMAGAEVEPMNLKKISGNDLIKR